jgi:hypothetical protein
MEYLCTAHMSHRCCLVRLALGDDSAKLPPCASAPIAAFSFNHLRT